MLGSVLGSRDLAVGKNKPGTRPCAQGAYRLTCDPSHVRWASVRRAKGTHKEEQGSSKRQDREICVPSYLGSISSLSPAHSSLSGQGILLYEVVQ